VAKAEVRRGPREPMLGARGRHLRAAAEWLEQVVLEALVAQERAAQRRVALAGMVPGMADPLGLEVEPRRRVRAVGLPMQDRMWRSFTMQMWAMVP
jgi:hypothetical protein